MSRYVCNKCGAMFMSDMVFPGCPECEHKPRFVSIPLNELEELVAALEKSGKQLGILHHSTGYDRAYETAAKFRTKYL